MTLPQTSTQQRPNNYAWMKMDSQLKRRDFFCSGNELPLDQLLLVPASTYVPLHFAKYATLLLFK